MRMGWQRIPLGIYIDETTLIVPAWGRETKHDVAYNLAQDPRDDVWVLCIVDGGREDQRRALFRDAEAALNYADLHVVEAMNTEWKEGVLFFDGTDHRQWSKYVTQVANGTATPRYA